jgi:hypothetical protein
MPHANPKDKITYPSKTPSYLKNKSKKILKNGSGFLWGLGFRVNREC